MRGAKRFAASESNPDANDSALRNKRIMAGSPFDIHRAEPSQQQLMATPQLDIHRAESSRQHVRALNNQFASWVQTQLKNHPDELWEDGVRDYLTHASNIMEKFSDVVQWLKANALKGENLSAAGSDAAEKKTVPEIKNNEGKFFQGKSGIAPVPTTGFATSWGSGGSSSTLASQAAEKPPVRNNEIKPFQGNSFSSPVGTTTSFSTSWSFGGSSSAMGSHASEKPPVGRNNETNLFQGKTVFTPMGTTETNLFQVKTAFTPMGTTTNFASSLSSGVFSNSRTPALFGSQSSVPVNKDTSEDADGENDLEQPSSPSVKKSEEKGIATVHEVKCKLYVKSSDPADKDAWKDKGTGQLSIKCQEGISKGTKESKPTIVIQNDVGRILLNALLYPGIKTNAKKNSIVAIFHTSSDSNDGGENNSVVARTFLIRLKTEEDRNKLETAIKEYAPAS